MDASGVPGGPRNAASPSRRRYARPSGRRETWMVGARLLHEAPHLGGCTEQARRVVREILADSQIGEQNCAKRRQPTVAEPVGERERSTAR